MPQPLVSQLEELENEKREKEIRLDYTDDEKQQQSRIYLAMRKAWDQQNTPRTEFDDVTLLERCRINRLARNSFLTPVDNDGEVRVVTGTSEGKLDAIFNSVFNQNIETEVRAFNEYDVEDYGLGRTLTKTVKRTKEIEREGEILPDMLLEMLSMPAVFVQEIVDDRWYYDRVLEEGDWNDLWDFKIPTFRKEKWLHKKELKKVLWPCENVLLASMEIPRRLFHTQPYVITYRIRHYDDARTVYCKSPRWQYVKPGMPLNREFDGDLISSRWRFSDALLPDQVEEIIYKSVAGDELQVTLNGVPMLPVGCPYIGIGNKFKYYDMTMEGMKSIGPKFAYCRPMISMTQVLQALKDEAFRLMILKNRQDIWHPIVTQAQTILSKDMWLPSAITYGISKSQVEDLLGDRPISNSDQLLQDMVEKEIEKFINVSPILQGTSEGQMTAHETAQRMKQALIMLGTALTSYIRMIMNCDYLRLYNILHNKTSPIDTRYNSYTKKSEDVYETFTIDEVELFDGLIGTEVVQFLDRQLLPAEEKQALDIEEKSRKEGKPKSFTFVDIDRLRKIPYMFYISAQITEKRSSILEREIFKKDAVDAIDLGNAVGRQVDPDYITTEFAKRTNFDAGRLYVVPQPVMPGAMDMNVMPGGPNMPGSTPRKPGVPMKKMDTSAMIPNGKMMK